MVSDWVEVWSVTGWGVISDWVGVWSVTGWGCGQ